MIHLFGFFFVFFSPFVRLFRSTLIPTQCFKRKLMVSDGERESEKKRERAGAKSKQVDSQWKNK